MSVSSLQLHKQAGLGSTSFGSRSMKVDTKTSGVSSQATKNLSNATAASRPSVFSFSHGSQYNRVDGVNTRKGVANANMSRRRAALNAQNQSIHRSYSNDYSNMGLGNMMFVTGQTQTQHKSGIEQVMQAVQAGFQGISMGMQLVNTLKGGQALDQSMAGLGSGPSTASSLTSSAASSAVSSMSSAQTSSALSSAINNAKSQLSSMQQKAESSQIEEKASKAEENMDSYKQGEADAKTEYQNASDEAIKCNGAVTSCKTLRDSKLSALKQADAKYGAAVEKHTQAQDAKANAQYGVESSTAELESAESTLASTPETITDAQGNSQPNPAYQQAKQAVEQAKTKKQEAEKSLQEAEKNEQAAAQEREQAKQNVDSNNTAVDQAEKDLDSAQTKLDTANKNQRTSHAKCTKAHAAFEQAHTQYENARQDVQTFKEYQNDTKQLEAAINNQSSRLEQMRQQETTRINEIDAKIEKLAAKNERKQAKIDTSNGMNFIERNRQAGIDSRNAEMQQLMAEREQIQAGMG